MQELDSVISALELITKSPETNLEHAQLARLKKECVNLSRLECLLPGAYAAATSLLLGIQASGWQSHRAVQAHLLNAVELLRALPFRG